MQLQFVGGSSLSASRVILGMMRASELSPGALDTLVRTALDQGINLFDHADIYGDGQSETRFGELLARDPSLRGRMLIQFKCGIRDGLYDLSRAHILRAVEDSLSRLRCDHLDLLLLHRPDALMEPEEIVGAFDSLAQSGKALHFGVSNFGAGEMDLLRRAVRQPILVNQLQFSAAHTPLLDANLNVDMLVPSAANHTDGVLNACRRYGVTIQTWSSLQYGYFEGTFLGSERYAPLNTELNEIARTSGVAPEAVAIAWILRHPARMQAIVGTTNEKRLQAICKAADMELTRDQWYAIYKAAGNRLP